jgi:hypothetical protein
MVFKKWDFQGTCPLNGFGATPQGFKKKDKNLFF